MNTGMIPILAAPHFDPGAGRIEIEAPAGLTLAEHVALALPHASETDLCQARVTLVTDRGAEAVDRSVWHCVRPRPGVRVVIRILAGKNTLKSILSIVITVAAIAVGQIWGPQFGAMLGLTGKTATAVGTALLTAGVQVVGTLLLNALVPPVAPESREARHRYEISGWRNVLDPGGAVPVLLGRMRYAPPFAALSHTEIVGDDQYVRALFTFGEGPIEISDLRIGETSIGEYTDVQVEIREGRDGDAPQTIIPRQIAEEAVGVELTRPLPRDALGEVIEGQPSIETPVVRTTGADARSGSVILAFPAGMVRFDDEGRSHQEGVRIRIQQRLVTDTAWQTVTTLNIRAKKVEGFYRQHTWRFPSRGRWQVRMTLLTAENTDSKVQRRVTWAALQTLRPEYPLNYPRPLALLAIRAKATHQLSGNLDSVNAIGSLHCLDYDHGSGAWVERATSNPAALYRHVLQSAANPRAVSNAALDLEQLEDWHNFCRIHDLKYDRVLDQAGTTLREVLAEIAAAGRATPRHDGVRWGVTIDRPAELIVDHVGPRNSWAFATRRAYLRPPHAFRVPFLDATNDWKPAERIVRWPGYVGEITLTEALDLPGKTDPAEVWREARRRMYEAIHRPDTYQVTQDGPARVATRGDTVTLSHFVLDAVQTSARVQAVAGSLIELDEEVTIKSGKAYGIRFRVFANGNDTIGTSVVRTASAEPGETSLLSLDGAGVMPKPGDLVYFGEASQEAFPLVVTGVEAAEDMASILHMVDAAPIIDTLLAADTVPVWSGRVGAEIGESLLEPPAPQFTVIVSDSVLVDEPGQVDFLIVPAGGTIAVMTLRVAHRLAGASSWTTIDIPAADGGATITGYAVGDNVELRARAISVADIAGPWGATIPVVIGAGDAALPGALDSDAITVTTLPGGALIQFAVGNDPDIDRVQLYRSRTSSLNRAMDKDGAALPVARRQSYSLSVGDLTRTNLLTSSAWSVGSGWTVAGGELSHAPGTAGAAAQPISTKVNRWYRMGYTVSGRTAGTVTPRFTGGTTVTGTAVSANGARIDRLQAVEGNNSFQFSANGTFDGVLSDALLYMETAACLDPGLHYLWIEPQNADGMPGPLAGPISIDVA